MSTDTDIATDTGASTATGADLLPLKQIIEGALLAAGQPLSMNKLMQLFEEGSAPERDALRDALTELQSDCEGRGFELKEVASGWRFQVREEMAPWVNRLWDEKPQKYSRALLETLALVAYRQPITRGDIEEIRGVAVSSHIIKTLLERDWVKVVGHRDVPGRPSLYATTRQFLDYFNLKSLEELPSLGDIRDLDDINATLNLEGADTPPPPELDDEMIESAAINPEGVDADTVTASDVSEQVAVDSDIGDEAETAADMNLDNNVVSSSNSSSNSNTDSNANYNTDNTIDNHQPVNGSDDELDSHQDDYPGEEQVLNQNSQPADEAEQTAASPVPHTDQSDAADNAAPIIDTVVDDDLTADAELEDESRDA